MKYLFITGTSNAGKSTLAKKIAETIGGTHVDIDDLREEMWEDPALRPWVDFFADKDEKEYWETTTPEQDFKNLVDQSEAFWPTILAKINEIMKEGKPAVFEAVNVLPHLAKKDLPFNGVVLVSDSSEKLLERLKARPRWGNTEELQKIESERFVEEANFYRKEAEKHGYKVFSDSSEAEAYILQNLL